MDAMDATQKLAQRAVLPNETEAVPPATPPSVADQLAALEHDDASARAVATASQWRLMWWRFRKNKLALASAVVLALLYTMALFASAIAPYNPEATNATRTYAPPQTIYFMDTNGNLTWPYVLGFTSTVDPETLRRVYAIDYNQVYEVGLFVRGEPYRLFGFIPTEVRLFGPRDGQGYISLLGSDKLGRDLFSRMVHATRVSLFIGLASIFVSLLLGVLIGGVSGFYGGAVDMLIQRVMEFLDAVPKIPLWMGLSAAIPLTWPPLRTYFAITLILALLGWVGMARVVRGRFLSLREEDFVMAARVSGANEWRIITRHMLPSFISHIIAALTLAIPSAILAETSLSFLGLGLKPPINSFGVLLQEAQNIRAIATAPWLMLPAVAVIVIVIAYNFLGDGLRDAADPYA
jgi:peptide/nickel transport system permease protein